MMPNYGYSYRITKIDGSVEEGGTTGYETVAEMKNERVWHLIARLHWRPVRWWEFWRWHDFPRKHSDLW